MLLNLADPVESLVPKRGDWPIGCVVEVTVAPSTTLLFESFTRTIMVHFSDEALRVSFGWLDGDELGEGDGEGADFDCRVISS